VVTIVHASRSSTKTATKRRILIAYHEAGHAVVARKLGVEVVYVVMFPTDDGGVAGAQTRSAAYLAGGMNVTAKVSGFETDAKVALAGPIAQQQARPGSFRAWQAADDFANARSAAVSIALLLAGEPLPSPRTSVEVTLTNALLDSANVTLKRLQDETDAIIAVHWPAVERVAQFLTGRDLLDQTELDRLIGDPLAHLFG
jgi:hypothetical protein